MVDPGEKVSETVKREFMEEALNSAGISIAFMKQSLLNVLTPPASNFQKINGILQQRY